METFIRIINKRRLSAYDIACATFILAAWQKADSVWLSACLFIAYVFGGALMDAREKRATTKGKE